MTQEIITLLVVVAVLVIGLALLRRAGDRSKERSAKAMRDRVVGAPEPAAKPARERKRPPVKKPGKKPAKVEEPEDEEEEEEEEEEDEDEREKAEAEAAGEGDLEARAAFRQGLTKTRGGFVAKLGKIFGKKKIDEDVLPQLEEVLFTADIGPRAADRIFDSVKKGLTKDELTDAQKIWSKIRETSGKILDVGAPPVDWEHKKPFVLLVLGVNGVGKTTTIGKLAAHLAKQGKQVVLAAGDTFRAAATEQLEVWGDRAKATVVKGKAGGDPSSVIFDAVKRGVDEGADVVICDTAGRLHTKTDLMDELKKVRRVMDKAMPGSPHETWMVLDATTGQNAITQAKTFKEAMEITGIVITKLDGSAKGGVILGICDELKVPVRYIGVGEKLEDLRPFDARAFVDALYEDADEASAA
ncbi:MAG: signal recognition particle-docking protein FtsY [Deltaproteobacteria bacterium]|nr:signal recognition particle-docking protein FtsY [Kofleriaceae bacterium]